MKKKEVGIKRSMELEQAISYIEDLASSLEKGEVFIQQGQEYLQLSPKSNVLLEVKAKKKKEKEKFSFTISWYNEEMETEGEEIKISSEQPPEEVVEVEETVEEQD